ncbi:hypothetical protein K523DRAFT_391900 [Schizophyllum commune Tattone D]|nr:hypothetical protein K523DRAFT_391900 [Schizophyllum commune Tattone D]
MYSSTMKHDAYPATLKLTFRAYSYAPYMILWVQRGRSGTCRELLMSCANAWEPE